jgi:hypothetical protein
MIGSFVDRVSRLLAHAPSRRTLGGAVLGTVAGLLGLADAEAAPCPKGTTRCRQRCIPRRQCCTTAQCQPRATGRRCHRGRCRCRAGQKLCRGRCLARAAACPPAPDAACPGPGTANLLIAPTRRIAQTFTERNGGRLTAVEFVFGPFANATGSFQLQINTVDAAGVPQNNTIATALLPASAIVNAPGPIPFAFPVPPTLLPGRHYALVLSRPEVAAGFAIRFTSPGPCGGQLFQSVSATGVFLPVTALDGARVDLLYRTVVRR